MSKQTTLREVQTMLDDVLAHAHTLGLTDGDTEGVSIARGVTGWIIRDPDNVAYLFLPVSKGVGATKGQAWATLHAIREVMFAVMVRHPAQHPKPADPPADNAVFAADSAAIAEWFKPNL